MELEKISIDKIRMYENNTKEHPEWQVEEIVKSISEFGYKDPIALDENNVIIEGHARYLALLGFENIELEEIMEVDAEEVLEIEEEETENERTRHKLICPHCGHIALKSEFKEVMEDGEDT